MSHSGRCAGAVLILFISYSISPGQSVVRSDTQQWNDVSLIIPLNKSIDFNVYGGLRFGRDLSHSVDERLSFGFSFRLGKYLSVAPYYLNVATQPFKGRKLFEDRISLPLTIHFTLAKFRFSDRNMFERRFRHPGGESTRFRQRLLIEHPFGADSKKLSVVFGGEIYYDWSVNAWVRSRFQAGISKAINKQLTLDLYYLRQNDSHSLPGNLNAMVASWRIRM